MENHASLWTTCRYLYVLNFLLSFKVKQPSYSLTEGDILNPDRITGKWYDLEHKDNTKLCPKSVTRCEQCRLAFNTSYKLIIKSVGVCEKTKSQGSKAL